MTLIVSTDETPRQVIRTTGDLHAELLAARVAERPTELIGRVRTHEADLDVVPVPIGAEALQVDHVAGLVRGHGAGEHDLLTDAHVVRRGPDRDDVAHALEQHGAVPDLRRLERRPRLVDRVRARRDGERVAAVVAGRGGQTDRLPLAQVGVTPEGHAHVRVGCGRAGQVQDSGDRRALAVRNDRRGRVDREVRHLLLADVFGDRVRGGRQITVVAPEQRTEDVVAGDPEPVVDREVRPRTEPARLQRVPRIRAAGRLLLKDHAAHRRDSGTRGR